MLRSALIDLNLVELKQYLSMVSVGKCSGSCDSGNDLSGKIYVF